MSGNSFPIQVNAPAVHTGRSILFHSISTDVHKTQAASGLNVLVAIAADVEGRAAEEMTMAMAVVAMAVMSAMTVTTMPMTARRGRGHRGGTEGDRGNEGE